MQRPFRLAALAGAALLVTPPALATTCPEKSDILVRSDASLAPVRPPDCSTLTQTPPEFTWPPQAGRNSYTVMLKSADGKVQSRSTSRNWLLWDRALPPGAYSWQVKVTGAANETSAARTFTIAPDPVSFVVPDADSLLKRVREAKRPRTWRNDTTDPLGAARSERAAGWKALIEEVDNKLPAGVQPEPASGSIGSNYEDAVAEQKRTLAAALAWSVTRDRKYAADATRRLMSQARWDPGGTTGYAANDMANRSVAWTLALGFDWMHEALSREERAALAGAIRARTQPMFDDVVPRLSGYPYDSHGNVTLNLVAAIGALMAGELPEADAWVREAIPMAAAWTSPWGWQDGGFANGTAQMFWDTSSNLPAWYILRNAAGVDLAKKEWVRNHARFMAYFAPPGAPAGVFGDGQELALPEVSSRVAKSLARFAPAPLARWYAGALAGEDASRLELLLSPREGLAKATMAPPMPHAALFPSVGWVAMHSDLADPMRTSVYFKASPYGSYNHSHADQNSFVIDHRGERLAIASGYYDGYQTPHWKQWYKQTASANAITFDGAQGQGFNDKRFSGEVTRFETTARFDYAVGHAEKAYGGALTRALRTVVYLRPGTVLVYDSLASGTPRTWEWNLHTVNRMVAEASGRLRVRNGSARMCVAMLQGPESRFEQTDRFPTPPSGARMPNQWHGTFTSSAKSTAAEYVVLMRIGADCPQASATRSASGWRVEVDGTTVSLAGEEVAVK